MVELRIKVLIIVSLIAFFCFLAIQGCQAALPVPINPPNVEWYHEYQVWGFDQSFVQTADGGCLVVGNAISSNGAGAIVKIDENGDIQWSHTLRGIGSAGIYAIHPTSDGGYIASGLTNTGSDYSSFKVYLVKLDAAGNIQWTNAFGGTGGEGANDAIETKDGGYIVTGFTKSYNHYNDIYVAKTDSQGNKLWDNHYGDSESNHGIKILTAPDNGYLILTTQTPLGQIDSATAQNVIIKIDENGNYKSKTLVGNLESPYIWDMTLADDGNILLSGTIYSNSHFENRYLAEYSISGDKQWEKTVSSSNANCIYELPENDGTVLLETLNQITYLTKIDLNKNQIWKTVIDLTTQRNFGPQGLRRAADGGYILFGLASPEAFPRSTTQTVFLVIKLGSEHYPGIISLNSSYYESPVNRTLSVPVTRTDGNDDNVTVEYSTINDSALAGIDFMPVKGMLTFNNSETMKIINLTLLSENNAGINTSFKLALSNVTGGALLGSPNLTTITIPYSATPTPAPTLGISGIGLPFSIGNSSSLVRYPSVEKTVSTLLALVIGVLLAWLWPWLAKLLQFLYDAIKSYLQKQFSTKEAKIRGVKAKVRPPLFMGISIVELFVGVACILLIGITFSYAKNYLTDLNKLMAIVFAAGISIVITELVRRYFAYRYKAETEYQFWGVGAITLFITSLLHLPFSRPARTIINKPEELGARKQGIISIMPCIASLIIAIVFLLLRIYGNGFEMLGREGFYIGMMLCVYSLLPFEPMDGKKVIGWNKWAWGIVFIPSLLLYLGMLLFFNL